MTRRESLLKHIDVVASVGLEIGPLTRPIVTTKDGEIYYIDHLCTEDLRRKYANDATVDKSRIVDVSFVTGDGDLAHACGGRQFDYVIASHVIEHTSNMIAWLRDVGAILRSGGRLVLAVPDKRYTFDRLRLLVFLSAISYNPGLKGGRTHPRNKYLITARTWRLSTHGRYGMGRTRTYPPRPQNTIPSNRRSR